jgi:hypothetical protein
MVEDALLALSELRVARAEMVKNSLNNPSPQTINELIADSINALEAIYLCLNLPTDGFISFTPKNMEENA